MVERTTTEVVVVGGGAVGAASAWWLARSGRDVVLLERFERGHTRGGSHGRSRIFRLAYSEPDYVRLALDSLPLWRELEAGSGVSLLHVTGGVDHGDPEALAMAESAMAACGVASQRLPAGEAAGRWPGLRFDGEVLHQADAGRIDADATVEALHRAAAGHGALLRFDEPVRSIRAGTDRVEVHTDHGSYRAGVAVVACGPWTPAVLGGAVELPPIRVTFEQPAFFTSGVARWPAFIHHGGAPVGASGAASAAYGLDSAEEGIKIGLHMTGVETSPDAAPAPDPVLVERVAAYAARWVPGVDPEPVSVGSCPYDTTPTEDFVIDRRGPVVVATGFSGHGFKFVPAVGRIVAGLVAGTPTPLDRFRLP